jgi:hypothetical protein
MKTTYIGHIEVNISLDPDEYDTPEQMEQVAILKINNARKTIPNSYFRGMEKRVGYMTEPVKINV